MLHTELPIYKTGCDLVKLGLQVNQQMRRDLKRTLGEKIAQHCCDLVNLMAMANATRGQERIWHIRELLKIKNALTVLFRVGHDMNCIATKVWAASVELLESIGKQGNGWINKTANTKAPAA